MNSSGFDRDEYNRIKKEKEKTLITFIFVFMFSVAVGVAGAIFYFNSAGRNAPRNAEQEVTPTPLPEGINTIDTYSTIMYEGREYEYNRNLTNILFLGVDQKNEFTNAEFPGEGGQSDCIMILSLDSSTKKVTILQISRDIMTDVDIYTGSGNYYTTVHQQLATQYGYGDGKETSCFLTQRTVGELLYNLPISGYLALDNSAISLMNDAVGGVTLTIPEDYTYIDEAFVAGAKVTLSGEQAEKYVRSRNKSVTGSNNERMERQTQYIPALIEAIKHKYGSSGLYDLFESLLEPYMVTDLTGEQIDEFGGYNLVTDTVYTVPGEVVAGEKYDEFYVDEEGLKKILIKMFYKPV